MIKIIEGVDLKNLEMTGKSDPYVVISMGGKEGGKTQVIPSNLNP